MKKILLFTACAALALSALPSAQAQVESRDHRGGRAKAPPKGAKAPVRRDHRGKGAKNKKAPPPKGPVKRDHRGAKTPPPAKGPSPAVRDHRKGAKAMPATKPKARPETTIKAVRSANTVKSAADPSRPRMGKAGMPKRAKFTLVRRYFPAQASAGEKVRIFGRNFDPGAQVFVGGNAVDAKVKKHKIVFVVPDGSAGGEIRVKQPNLGYELVVGPLAVIPKKDIKRKDWKVLRRDHRKKAKKNWQADQATRAKKREERLKKYKDAWARRKADRQQRRQARRAEIKAKLEAKFLTDPQIVNELRLHARRLARLMVLQELAHVEGKVEVGVRVDFLLERENSRHEKRMANLQAGLASN